MYLAGNISFKSCYLEMVSVKDFTYSVSFMEEQKAAFLPTDFSFCIVWGEELRNYQKSIF